MNRTIFLLLVLFLSATLPSQAQMTAQSFGTNSPTVGSGTEIIATAGITGGASSLAFQATDIQLRINESWSITGGYTAFSNPVSAQNNIKGTLHAGAYLEETMGSWNASWGWRYFLGNGDHTHGITMMPRVAYNTDFGNINTEISTGLLYQDYLGVDEGAVSQLRLINGASVSHSNVPMRLGVRVAVNNHVDIPVSLGFSLSYNL